MGFQPDLTLHPTRETLILPPMPELVIRRQRQTFQYFTEDLGKGIGLDMMLISGGTFMMGSPEDEPERTKAEGPQHEVTVPTFFMGRFPITQGQWRVVAEVQPQIKQKLDADPSSFKGDDRRPVEQVSWYDAEEFCLRLSRQTGKTYRLPSEAEWEYACRAGTTTPFHFGETISTDLANYDGNYTYGKGSKGEYRNKTNPVDLFKASNAFGLSDMHGNVWEWCLDHWHDNYEGAPTDGTAWLSSDESAPRVCRGGSWDLNPGDCRSAFRYYNNPGFRLVSYGFRVMCEARRT